MCRLKVILPFFLLLFQSFCDEFKYFEDIFVEAADRNVNAKSRIEIINIDWKIEERGAIIRLSFSEGLLFPNYFFFKEVKSIEFRNSKNMSFCVSCQELRYIPDSGAVKLSGNVLFTLNDSGKMLETTSPIFIDLRNKRAFSEGEFNVISRNGSKISGSGFIVNLDNGEYEVKGMKSRIKNKGFYFRH